MSNMRLTVLFAPLDGWGHVNACHGLAEAVRESGHRAVFALEGVFSNKIKQFGFDVELLSEPKPTEPPGAEENIESDTDSAPKKRGNNFVDRNAEVFKQSPVKVAEMYVNLFTDGVVDALRARDEVYARIVARVRPNVIVVDSYMSSPALTNCGVPWVWLYSAAPLMLFNVDTLPPPWLGLPTNSGKSEWTKHRLEIENVFKRCYQKVSQWYEDRGALPLPKGSNTSLHPESTHLNIYMTPEELDYKEVQPLAHNWHRVDGFVRTTDDTFEIPECLRETSGKLVFLSMGSFGSSHVELMTRLIAILSKSQHRFIVSLGPQYEEYKLPDNMWGQEFVPQTAVLPLVDLVLTHGGNNTVTETFYFGKPMLVLPLFADQFDNAQRLQETGLGLRLDPFCCTEEELLTSIDKLVNDSDLAQRMKSIGDRIRESNDKQVIAKLIENIFYKN